MWAWCFWGWLGLEFCFEVGIKEMGNGGECKIMKL